MNIFLTGGTGFIGSHVAMELISNGHNVTILARNKNKVPGMLNINGIEVVQVDITDKTLIKELMEEKDACIHVALNYTKNTGAEVLEDYTLPTVLMSDIAVEEKVKHFIYTSSTAVDDIYYMVSKDLYIEETENITEFTKQYPATFYGATRAASENYLIA